MPRKSRNGAIDSRLLDRFSHAVDTIYDAALRPARWPSALKAIADVHDCRQCVLNTPLHSPRVGGFVFAHGVSEADTQLWATKYVQHDLLAQRAHELGLIREGNVLFTEDLVPEATFEQSIIYREFHSRLDIWHTCAGIVFDGSAPGTMPAGCGIFRGRASPSFSEHDRKLHSLTVRHLSHAIGSMLRIRDAEFRLACTTAALDRIASGIVLFGERGKVAYANPSAMSVFTAGDGLALRSGGLPGESLGLITATRSQEDDALRKCILDAISMNPLTPTHFSRGLAITRPSARRPYIVQISSLALDNELSAPGRHVRAIGFVSDPECALRLDERVLKRVYGMTSAECRTAQAFLTGTAMDQVAARLSVSENTVKTHLRSIFEKTGTHRQAELMRLLVGLASTDP